MGHTCLVSPFRRAIYLCLGDEMQTSLAVRAKISQSTMNLRRKTRIAIWDVGVFIGDIELILKKWNDLNGDYIFTQVFVSAPRQILLAGERTIDVAKHWLSNTEIERVRDNLSKNLFTDNVMSVAEEIRNNLGYDRIALVTPHLLAFTDDETFKYNFFSNSEGNVIVVSAFNMREYSRKARRPFAASMGGLLISQILDNEYQDIRFHQKNTGCLFDLNEKHRTIVKTFRNMHIENSCLQLIPEDARTYVEKLVGVLAKHS